MEAMQVDLKSEVEKLFTLMHNTSLVQFNNYCAANDFQKYSIDTKQTKLHAHWISFILVASKPLKITLKTHYAIEDIKSLVAKTLCKEKADINDDQVTDFMKEFCNLCAGNVKKQLLKHVEMGISLPLIARGFDEIFMPAEKENLFKDYWKLQSQSFGITVVCSADLEIMDRDSIARMDFNVDGSSSNDEIDFF